MKIHKIILKDYLQFKDLEIDLTYPLGHEKAGQPLDKVCFIGQSGTGKTTLLRLVKYAITGKNLISAGSKLSFPRGCHTEVEMEIIGEKVGFAKGGPNTMATWYGDFSSLKKKALLENQPLLLYFPADGIQTIFNKDLELGDAERFEIDDYSFELNQGHYLDLGWQSLSMISRKIFHSIAHHQAQELKFRNDIASAVLAATNNGKLLEEAKYNYNQWKANNPNPLDELGEKTNSILERLGVRIKTETDTDTISNVGEITLRTNSGENLQQENWSTGIRQIVETAAPLTHLKPHRAIVLIDEPEKSLYPDVQSEVVNFYTNLTTDCQFFYATHSPIIAASFDPWEIVELKWDPSNRFVIQETNYEGERHVDNYTVYPKYLRWDRILMDLFDLKEEGNSKFRQEELLKAVRLKHKIEEEVAAGRNKGPEFKEMVAKFEALSNKLAFYE